MSLPLAVVAGNSCNTSPCSTTYQGRVKSTYSRIGTSLVGQPGPPYDTRRASRRKSLTLERPMKKSDVLEIVEKLSNEEEVNIDELIDTLAFRRAVEKGLAAADAGDEITLEEFEELS